MTSSIRHSGVMRAALSLEYAEPGEPGVVQFLTSGGSSRIRIFKSSSLSVKLPVQLTACLWWK